MCYFTFGCHRTIDRLLIELAVSKCMTVFGYIFVLYFIIYCVTIETYTCFTKMFSQTKYGIYIRLFETLIEGLCLWGF